MGWFLWTVLMFAMNIVFAGLAAYNSRPVAFILHTILVGVFFAIADEMQKDL
jgi:hypothetical protein